MEELFHETVGELQRSAEAMDSSGTKRKGNVHHWKLLAKP
jgi:hypothetical protein